MINSEVILYKSDYSPFIDATINSIVDEWVVLNNHLEKQLSEWSKLVDSWALSINNTTSKDSLTLSILVARNILSNIYSSNVKSANLLCNLWASTKIYTKMINLNDDWKLNLINSNPAYEEEINTYKQPGVPEGTCINNNIDLVELELSIQNSFDLIKDTSLRIRNAVQYAMSTFIPLNLPPGMENGSCISFTSRNAPGAVFISMTPVILLAESIVHESVHNIVYNANRLIEFVKPTNTNKLLKSPLRDDARPIYGILHQAIVLHYLVEFYCELINNSDNENVKRNAKSIEKRMNQLQKDLKMSLETLSNNKEELLDHGQNLVNDMKQTIT